MPSTKKGKSKNDKLSLVSNGVGTNVKQTFYREGTSTASLENSINNSMRLFGIPHQFTAENDPRIGGTTNLGRCFAERIIMEAPIIALKPGKPKFLPGMSESEKANFLSRVQSAIGEIGRASCRERV